MHFYILFKQFKNKTQLKSKRTIFLITFVSYQYGLTLSKFNHYLLRQGILIHFLLVIIPQNKKIYGQIE